MNCPCLRKHQAPAPFQCALGGASPSALASQMRTRSKKNLLERLLRGHKASSLGILHCLFRGPDIPRWPRRCFRWDSSGGNYAWCFFSMRLRESMFLNKQLLMKDIYKHVYHINQYKSQIFMGFLLVRWLLWSARRCLSFTGGLAVGSPAAYRSESSGVGRFDPRFWQFLTKKNAFWDCFFGFPSKNKKS